MIKLFEITKLLSFTALTACVPPEDLPENHFQCKNWSQLYSHTILYCDGEVEDSFIACNPRKPPSERGACTNSHDLMDLEQNCWLQNICYEEEVER